MNITKAVLDQMNRNPLYHAMGIQVQEAHAGRVRRVASYNPNPPYAGHFRNNHMAACYLR